MIKALGILKGNWTIILLFVLVGCISRYIYLQSSTIEKLRSDLTVSQANVALLTANVNKQTSLIDNMNRSVRDNLDATQDFNRRIAEIREDQNDIQNKISRYSGRLYELSLEKPGLIERLANSAFDDVLRDFARTSQRAQPASADSGADSGETPKDF